MPTANKSYTLLDQGWIIRIRPPSEPGYDQVIVALHGWTGDENSMEVFLQKIGQKAWCLSPRGPIKTDTSGYGWIQHHEGANTDFLEMQNVTALFHKQTSHWLTELNLPKNNIGLIGFSQGAALAYSLAVQFPEEFQKVAALSGPLPNRLDQFLGNQLLPQLNLYIAHGINDETVLIQHALEAYRIFNVAGAKISYCESDVGHKVSAECMNKLADFFKPVA